MWWSDCYCWNPWGHCQHIVGDYSDRWVDCMPVLFLEARYYRQWTRGVEGKKWKSSSSQLRWYSQSCFLTRAGMWKKGKSRGRFLRLSWTIADLYSCWICLFLSSGSFGRIPMVIRCNAWGTCIISSDPIAVRCLLDWTCSASKVTSLARSGRVDWNQAMEVLKLVANKN